MTAKRIRRRRGRPGELRVRWGVLDGEGGNPDIVYTWGREVHRCDVDLVSYVLCCKDLGEGFNGGFLDELKHRGYDITTLNFSIRKATP